MPSRLRRRGFLLGFLGGLGVALLPDARAQFFNPIRGLRGAGGRARETLENTAVEVLVKALFPVDPAGRRFLREVPAFDGIDFGPFRPMRSLSRTAGGGFVLPPGAWQIYLQSYCLKFGTYERTGGDGFRVGVVAGRMAPTVEALLRNAYAHPEVAQQNIQQLIWGLLAGVALSEMAAPAQSAARSLLTPAQLLAAEAAGRDVPGRVTAEMLRRLPPNLQALAAVRDRLADAVRSGGSYRELEAIAVLAGNPPRHRDAIPATRWSAHPDGYLMRIASQTYRRTTVQIVRPEPLRISRDSRGRIARVAFADGSSLGLTYRDDLGPLRHRAYPELTVWGFATIAYTPAGGGTPTVVRNRGWTVVTDLRRLPPRRRSSISRPGPLLAGLASDLPGPLAQIRTIDVAPNLDPLEGADEDLRDALIDQMIEATGNRTLERLNEAHDRAEEYGELAAPATADSINDALDASHLRDGVLVVTVGDTDDRLGFIAEIHANLARALASATELFEGGLPTASSTGGSRGGGGGGPVWDPPSTTGAPGGSGQIRGLSGREF
jgi:hypothetical protein